MLKTIFVPALAAIAFLAGCTGGGPDLNTIMSASNAQKIDRTSEEPFVLVDLGRNFAERVSDTHPDFVSSMPHGKAQPFVIGVSDVLDIAIVSNNEEGFIDFTQSAVTPLAVSNLPRQVVASDGTVAIPQIGRVKASGRTVQSFETFLTRRLSEVLINPTAVVQMVERQSATVSLIGRVNGAGTIPLNLQNRRLLDVIGVAGGPTQDTEGLIVTLNRGSAVYRALLSDIYADKSLNIYLRDGDLVTVEPKNTRVQVLGATGGNNQIEFDEEEVTLIDVISRAGGLVSARAARKGVFIYREAPASQLMALGADLSSFATSPTIPTIFRVDLTRPDSFFTSKHFRMMDNDIVYVADSLNRRITDFFGASSTIVPNPVEYVRDSTLGN